MKSNSKYVLILLLIIQSCSKEDLNLSIKDVVVTDRSGNVINSNGHNDWNNMDLTSDPNFNSLMIDLCISLFDDYQNEICNSYSFCSSPNNYLISVFPNPVPKSETPRFRIFSDKKIISYAVGFKNLGDNELTLSSTLEISPPSYDIENLIGSFPYLKYNGMDFYINFLTEDSCMYFTKGKILYE
jgi:hypothetical protein